MAKFSGPSVIPGAQVQLPTGPGEGEFADLLAPSEAPQAAPAETAPVTTGQPIEAAPASPEVQQQPLQAEATDAEITDLQNIALSQEQQARERVPAFTERLGVTSLADPEVKHDEPFAVALERGRNLSSAINDKLTGSKITRAKLEHLQAGRAEAAFAQTDVEGNLVAPQNPAIKGSSVNIGTQALLYDPRLLDAGAVNPETGLMGIDPEFGVVAGLATESWLFQQMQGANKEPTPEALAEGEGGTETERFTKAAGNQQLGREIFQAWRREKARKEGLPTDSYLGDLDSIEPDTFTFLGDMMKEVYAEANPDVLYRDENARVSEEQGQVYFQMTPEGAAALNNLERQYKNLLSAPEVAPLTAPSPTAQPLYEARTRVRGVTTKVGDLKDTTQINESMKNYHEVAYVNDPQREGLAFMFGAQALLNHSNVANPTFANMFSIGPAKLQETENKRTQLLDEAERAKSPAEKAMKLKEAREYDPLKIMQSEREGFIKSLDALAKYSGKANHLTFSLQALTGRTHIQQTGYNPQAHLPVRFVVGGGNVYSWKAGDGSQVDRSFREIMAAHFTRADVNGVSRKGLDLDTETRLKTFAEWHKTGQLDSYIKMGNELKAALDNFDVNAAKQDIQAITSAKNPQEVGQLKQAFAQKYANDPISPETKAELAKHGAEGPVFAEAMMELAKYDAALKAGRPMSSSITVEMDGKTHGPATNAAIMGVESMAKRTGLIRNNAQTLTDDIDSRDAMGIDMKENFDIQDGVLYPSEQRDAYQALLWAAIDDRANFLKKSPMTMGYGQELNSLNQHVEKTVYNGPQSTKILDIMKKNGIEPDKGITFLHSMLVDSILEIMDPKVVNMSRLLRANNLLSTISNKVLYFDNAIGFRSYAAGKQVVRDETEAAKFTIAGRQTAAQFYRTQAEGSAVRPDQGPGGWGHGRVIPIAVQSYDGNMISRTGSGASWDKIQRASKAAGGKQGFVLPIFDAFKTDLGGFATVRQEANKNWVDGIRNHSYVTSIMQDWYGETVKAIDAEFKDKDPKQVIDISEDGPYRGLYYMFQPTDRKKFKNNLHVVLSKTIKMPAKPRGMTIETYKNSTIQYAEEVLDKIFKDMDAMGIPSSPDKLTNAQIHALIKIIIKRTELGERNAGAVRAISKDKDKLLSEFDRIGKEARQVDIA